MRFLPRRKSLRDDIILLRRAVAITQQDIDEDRKYIKGVWDRLKERIRSAQSHDRRFDRQATRRDLGKLKNIYNDMSAFDSEMREFVKQIEIVEKELDNITNWEELAKQLHDIWARISIYNPSIQQELAKLANIESQLN